MTFQKSTVNPQKIKILMRLPIIIKLDIIKMSNK